MTLLTLLAGYGEAAVAPGIEIDADRVMVSQADVGLHVLFDNQSWNVSQADNSWNVLEDDQGWNVSQGNDSLNIQGGL